MLDLLHLSHKVSEFDQFGWCVTPGDDDVHMARLILPEPFKDHLCIEPAQGKRKGEFIQEHDVILATHNLVLRHLPAVSCTSDRFIDVLRCPCEAIAFSEPIDAKLFGGFDLSPASGLCFNELDN